MQRPRLKRLLTTGVLIALAFNLLVFTAYVWSRGGQTTVVEIQNLNGAFRGLTDGIQVTPSLLSDLESVTLDVPDSGSIVLVLPEGVRSLPRPSGIDRVSIHDSAGNILFEEDFERLNRSRWQVVSGNFKVENGVLMGLEPDEMNSLLYIGETWSDYSVSVTYRNSRGGIIGSYLTDDGGLFYHFELIQDHPNFFNATNDGEPTGSAGGSLMRTSIDGPIRSFLAMATEPYPYVVLFLAVACILTLGLSQAGRLVSALPAPAMPERIQRWHWPYIVAAAIAIAAASVAYYSHVAHFQAIPHVPDEVSYLYQAHLLSTFRVTGVAPPVSDAFQFYEPHFLFEREGRWTGFYPFGHPLLLAFGMAAGAPGIIPPIVGAACVALVFALGRKLYGAWTGIVAAALLAVSPFFLMQSSNFMSHNTGTFYILLSLFFIVKRDKPILYGLIAGIAFGLGINTRPLPMVALMLPFGGLILWYLVSRAEDLRTWLRYTVPFVAGGALMALAMLAYNYGVTGDPLTSSYAGAGGPTSELFGFGDGHTLDIGLRNQAAQLMALLLVFNAWPTYAGLALLGLPFLLGTRNPWDYFLALCALLPIGIHVAYRYSGIYEGPRYWYEAMPFLVLLSARGAETAAAFLTDVASRIHHRLGRGMEPRRWAGGVIVYAAIAALVVWGTGGWLFGWAEEQDAPLMPHQASAREGLFGVDDRLNRLADDVDLENALVLVEPCGFFQSPSCYGSVFLRNLPDFDGEVVWARYMPEHLDELLAAYPDREVYIASWDPEASIRPFAPE